MAAPNPLQAFQRRCFFTQDELSTYSVDQMDLFLYITVCQNTYDSGPQRAAYIDFYGETHAQNVSYPF